MNGDETFLKEILNDQKALVFRAVHYRNVPWIIENGGLFARSAPLQDPNYVNIGHPELINKRSFSRVPISPEGFLSDYVPFYFTPFSMMMLNIITGYKGIPKFPSREIVFFVSSIKRIKLLNLRFVFTNGHALMAQAKFFNQLYDLSEIDWELLQKKDFSHDSNDSSKQFRYQAEALVFRSVPLEAFHGLCCFEESVKLDLDFKQQGLKNQLKIVVKPEFYF